MPLSTSEESLLLLPDGHSEEDGCEKSSKRKVMLIPRHHVPSIMVGTLVFLLLVNLVLAVGYAWAAVATCQCKSPLANLEPNIKVPFAVPSDYGSDVNITLTDELWAATHAEVGMVALPKSDALHPTETFPWDPSKGVYMLNAYHQLHCLELLYTSIREYQLLIPQTQPPNHIIHCLGALRSDVICAADDTPRFVSVSVLGDTFEQSRMCRDWTKLERWAAGHSACFKRVSMQNPHYGSLHEWKSCPDGSPYRGIVEDYFRERGGI